MPNIVQIKRSATTATPPALAVGELAYSSNSNNLFIGEAGSIVTKIGGKGTADKADAALPSASFTDSAVTSKLITGFVSAVGTVAATDTILQAINKLNGNLAASGSGTLTGIGVTTANGISGTSSGGVNPNLTLTLGAITPTTVNGLTNAALATGFSVAGGTVSKTLTVSNTLTLAGTDASTLNIGTGGTLGTAAFTASSAYATSAQGTLATNALPASSFTDTGVTGKLITGFVSGAGTVAATDNILQAINKLNGNIATKGSGTVTSIGVTTANGISGSSSGGATPNLTLTLGAITPTTVNGLTNAALATGFSVAGGTVSKTLTVSNTLTLAGTDASTLNIGTGGTLGTAAFTASSAYATSAQGTLATNALPASSFTDTGVTGKLITGFVSGAGTVAATDNILQAINKLNGNVVANLTAANNYANSLVVGLWDDRGNYDASVNTFPATGGSGAAGAVIKGDIWTISVAGTLGGVPLATRQTVRATIDTPGQTLTNWAIGLANTDIEDSITDGVTGRAPSQNAVFDALALKANLNAPTFTTLNTTGNVTLGDATTDVLSVSGYMAIDAVATPTTSLFINSEALTGISQTGIYAGPIGTAASTTSVVGVVAAPGSVDSVFTIASVRGFEARDAVKGATSTITNQSGVFINDQTRGTNNFGLVSAVSSGTNKWNIYSSGTAFNAFQGAIRIGSVVAPTVALDVTGDVAVSGTTIGGAASFTSVSATTFGGFFSGTSVPASGESVEIKHSGGVGSILSYDRTATAYRNLTIAAATTNILADGVTKVAISTNGIGVTGMIGVGSAPTTTTSILITSDDLTGVAQTGIWSGPKGTSAATTSVIGYIARPETAVAVYTSTDVRGYEARDAIKGVGSTITNQAAYFANDQTQGINNFGYVSAVSSAANKWNIYSSGTANNAFTGNVRIGSVVAPTVALDVTGAIAASSTVTGSNLSGTNTGDNAINSLYSGLVSNATHTGDVTGSGALTIAAGAVTLAKMASIATASILGRVTAATGVVEVLSATSVRTLLNVANGATANVGTVTSVAVGNGLVLSGVDTVNPTITVTSHAGTAGTLGTLTAGAGTLAVNLGITSITACAGNDSRLSDARTPVAHNQAWTTITATPTTLVGYGITDAVSTSATIDGGTF